MRKAGSVLVTGLLLAGLSGFSDKRLDRGDDEAMMVYRLCMNQQLNYSNT